MQAVAHRRDASLSSLGQRRGYSDLARFSLDLPWPRADSEGAVFGPTGDYPSPPMSGSPPIPHKGTHEADDQRVHHSLYQSAASHDVYRTTTAAAPTTTQADSRMLPGLSAPFRPYEPEPLDRMSYAYPRPEDHMQRPLSSYTPQHSQILSQHLYLPAPAPIPTSGAVPNYGTITSARPPTQESQQSFASPKSQRKTKGHVASACVPCKKAHLRCDAQRPCTRCVQNGKEDACVDVQHKKRGRPRLRDDHRGAGFDRLGHGQESNLRRPLSLYNPQGAMGGYGDDHLRRAQSYRVLKSQPPEPLVSSRMLERGAVSGTNIFPAPLQISTRPPEPAAFLTMDLEVGRASSTFLDAVGRQNVQGLRMTDLLSLEDRNRMMMLQRQLQDEQARREPNYLPPMFLKQEEDKVFRTLGFSREELSPYALDMMETLRFTDQAGQIRNVSARFGLAKYGSIFFIVVVLSTGFRPFPTPSPQSRDPRELGYSYPQGPQMPYGQPTPVSATFEGRGRSTSDLSYLQRQPMTPGQVMPGLSPRLSSAYAASPSRPDYPPGPSSYIPRSELSGTPSRPSQQPPGYQLPPIRNCQQQQQQQPQFQAQPSSLQHAQYPPQQPAQHHDVSPHDHGWPRDERQRVDIGGLIDHPDPTQRHHG